MSYGLMTNDWNDSLLDVDDVPAPVASGISEWGLTVLPPDAPAQVRRSGLIPVAFAVPLLFSAFSYAGGGLAFFTDLAFVALTGICITLLAVELLTFGHRQGVGAILIYGGVLIWFCHDYASYWFMHDFTRVERYFPAVRVDTVARAFFYHCLFIELMVIAYRFPVLRFADRLVVAVPELPDNRFYLWLVIAMLAIGWAGFIPTTDFLPVSLAKACLWFLPGMGGGPSFTVGRSGNTNVNLGGYVAQVLQVGEMGGILAAVYALLVARSVFGKVFGWLVWAFWVSYSFTSYRRGDIAFMTLPIMALMFVKFHAQRDPQRRASSLLRLGATLVAVSVIWFLVQLQTATRMTGGVIHLFRAVGNTMFSEGLNAWVVIPDPDGYAYDDWPGETVLLPIPNTVWAFVTGPVPRVLWTSKPVEKFALWYSAMISHDRRGLATEGAQGTTVSGGAVGAWYFRYGPPGVIEGALVYGWLMGVAERSLRRAQGQPIKVMFALAFATFVFRCYRDLWFHLLYPIMIGGVVFYVVIRLVFGTRPTHISPQPLVA